MSIFSMTDPLIATLKVDKLHLLRTLWAWKDQSERQSVWSFERQANKKTKKGFHESRSVVAKEVNVNSGIIDLGSTWHIFGRPQLYGSGDLRRWLAQREAGCVLPIDFGNRNQNGTCFLWCVSGWTVNGVLMSHAFSPVMQILLDAAEFWCEVVFLEYVGNYKC